MRHVALFSLLCLTSLVACANDDEAANGGASAAGSSTGGSSGSAGAGGAASSPGGAAGASGQGGGGGSAGGAAGAAGASGAAGVSGGATVENVRGKRYCEILLASVQGSMVHVEVYNTFGLNDCPAEAWAKVDAKQVASAEGATAAVLNGPRYWLIDAFENSTLKDPTVKALGGLEMRHAGSIDVPLSQGMSLGSKPYAVASVQRDTTFRFDAGKPVYELVDPDGAVYAMQSYSVQKVAQTEADLASLDQKLTLPAGWKFQTRAPTEPLHVTTATTGGVATVVQDDLADTYQREQP